MGGILYFLLSYWQLYDKSRYISQAEWENKKQSLCPWPEYIPKLVHLNNENYLHIKPKANGVAFLWSILSLFCKQHNSH